MNPCTLTVEDLQRVDEINAKVIGYSGTYHYAFFKGVLEQYKHIQNLLILGVYHGRDICFIQDILKRYHPPASVFICGVDKFDDFSCADWPNEKKDLPWKEAGFGISPTLEKAKANVESVGEYGLTLLKKTKDEDFLANTVVQFDFIYLDTSHDYATVSRQLNQVKRVCAGPDTIIAGDDYSDAGTWGVRSAVRDGFTSHEVFADWIWISDASRLK